MNSTDLLPQVDGWAKLVIGLLVAVAGALYTSSGFFKELFAYRTRVRELASLTPKPISAITGGDIATTIATGDLTAAVTRVAIAIEKATQQEEEREKDRMSIALEALILKLKDMEHADHTARDHVGPKRPAK